MNHTQGPWHVKSGSNPIADTGDYEAFLYVSADKIGKTSICYFDPEYIRDIDEEQVYTNAHLVSLAPDMIEAIQKLRGMEVWISDPAMKSLFQKTVYPILEKVNSFSFENS